MNRARRGGGFIKLARDTTTYFDVAYASSDDLSGIANQLSASTYGDKAGADIKAGWCYASKTYGAGDKGTPGETNDVCK